MPKKGQNITEGFILGKKKKKKDNACSADVNRTERTFLRINKHLSNRTV